MSATSPSLRQLPIKEYKKSERERKILLALVELYIATARPVGSQALKDYGFEDLASATIRNYFAKLETEGYLEQAHSSSGRIPTGRAFELYITEKSSLIDPTQLPIEVRHALKKFERVEESPLPCYLEQLIGLLSQITGTATFTLVPQLEQDIIIDLRLILLDSSRCVAVLITQFGYIKTETFILEQPVDQKTIKKIEVILQTRLQRSINKYPLKNTPTAEEAHIAQTLYTEIMTRYLISSSTASEPNLLRAGLSKLLNYPEFTSPAALVSLLSLFENTSYLQKITLMTLHTEHLTYWIGEKLFREFQINSDAALLTIPYFINHSPVGVIGLLGTKRLNYDVVVPLLKTFSKIATKKLTRSIHKFKLDYHNYDDQNSEVPLLLSGPTVYAEN